jgi:DNA-binding response OmpR family regulator
VGAPPVPRLIIALTGIVDDAQKSDALAAGVNDLMAKPMNKANLLMSLAAHWRRGPPVSPCAPLDASSAPAVHWLLPALPADALVREVSIGAFGSLDLSVREDTVGSHLAIAAAM